MQRVTIYSYLTDVLFASYGSVENYCSDILGFYEIGVPQEVNTTSKVGWYETEISSFQFSVVTRAREFYQIQSSNRATHNQEAFNRVLCHCHIHFARCLALMSSLKSIANNTLRQ